MIETDVEHQLTWPVRPPGDSSGRGRLRLWRPTSYKVCVVVVVGGGGGGGANSHY